MGVAATLPDLSEWTLSFDPANFEMSKIYQGPEFSALMQFGTVISQYLGSHFTEKSEIVGGNFFPAMKMQFGRFY